MAKPKKNTDNITNNTSNADILRETKNTLKNKERDIPKNIKKDAPKTTKKTTKKKKAKNYINNKSLLEEVLKSKERGRMTDEFGKMMMLLVKRYSSQGSYSGYTYVNDMESYALMTVCKVWNSFDPEKSSNPFAYFTQTIKRAFWQYLNQEEKHRDIRDEMLMKEGELPSHTYVDKYLDKMFAEEYDKSVKQGKSTEGFIGLVEKLTRQLVTNNSGVRKKVVNQLIDEMFDYEFEKNQSAYQFFSARINELLAEKDPTYKIIEDGDELEEYLEEYDDEKNYKE